MNLRRKRERQLIRMELRRKRRTRRKPRALKKLRGKLRKLRGKWRKPHQLKIRTYSVPSRKPTIWPRRLSRTMLKCPNIFGTRRYVEAHPLRSKHKP
jgi:hypothetical protein